jgi:hypothetical protein
MIGKDAELNDKANQEKIARAMEPVTKPSELLQRSEPKPSDTDQIAKLVARIDEWYVDYR